MSSLASIGQMYTGFVWFIIIIIIGSFIYRFQNVFIKKSFRKSYNQHKGHLFLKILKILFGFSMFLILISMPFYIYIASAFKQIIPEYLSHLLAISFILLTSLELFLSFKISETLLGKKKKMFLTLIVLIIFPLSILFTAYVPEMYKYPSISDCYIIDLPIKGTWHVGHAGGSEIVNYHCAIKSQMYAMDVIKVNDDGHFFHGNGSELTDFYSFGENIYSPLNGIVTNVVDSLSNAAVSFALKDTINPAGNHVVIQFEEDRYIFLVHLNKESVKVEIGDSIKKGDYIGEVGNSGNTSWPHLHMHIQNEPVLSQTAIGFPYRFRKMKRKRWFNWRILTNSFLIRNDLFRNIEKSENNPENINL